MSEWQPLPAGTVLRERYEVEALLGKGGFGAAYRARDRERFDQPCALKELSEFSLQVSTNPTVTFSGARRTFYRWRWMRVPSNDDGRLVSTLEAMRLESGFIPAL
jgi:serine/threonine protein kinase